MIESEQVIRLSCFATVMMAMALLEMLIPRRVLLLSRWKRWTSNLSITLINTLAVRIIFPTAAVGVALYAQVNSLGILNVTSLPMWASVIISIIFLDFVIYLQHVMFHALPLFWRIHRMHHVDLDFDVTTGIRFHPLEIVMSLFIKFAAIILMGTPAVSVIIFEVLLNATSLFNHGNIKLPGLLDRVLRWLMVTPDMHRVHHSDIPNETNSNFGFNLSVWDRLMGTYREQPKLGQTGMHIGIQSIRDEKDCVSLTGMLALPLINTDDDYPINRIS